MMRGTFDRAPSLLVSAVVHGAVGLAIFLFWPKTPPQQFQFGSGVPINVVTESPATRPAEEAEVVQEAATELPVPDPIPTPPAPNPTPKPMPKDFIAPTKPSAAPNRNGPGNAKPAEDDFLNSTASVLNKGGSRPSNAPQGQSQREKDLKRREGTYADLSAGEKVDFSGPLGSVWEGNCLVLGGARYDVYIEVVIGPNGYFKEPPRAKAGTPTDAYTQAAVTRAIAALKKVEPYKVPPRFADFRTSFHFDPKFC